MADNCIFCQIIAKTIPATIRYEDGDWLVFDNIAKTAPEHLLVIPKKHYATLEEVPVSDRDFYADLILIAKKVAREIGIETNYKLFMNVGLRVQAVHHLHLHVLGGWKPGESTQAGLISE